MRQLTILNNFFTAKQCRLSLDEGHTTQDIFVSTPDLRENAYSVWGDWGPMYTVELSKNQTIQITYRNRETQSMESHTLKPRSLQILSPVQAAERKIYPFFINLYDKKRRLVFHIYMDQQGEPARVDVMHIDKGVKHYATANNLEEEMAAV